MLFHRVWLRPAGRRHKALGTGIVMVRNSSSKLQEGARVPLVQPEAVRNAIQQLEQESGRMLNVVEKKILSRTKALNELEPDLNGVSTPKGIESLRLIKELEPLQSAWDLYTSTKQTILEAAPLLSDPDPAMRSLASTEQSQLLSVLSVHLSTTFPSLLVPPSSTSGHSAIMELKAGVGGDEASLFVSDLLRMYGRAGETNGWNVDVIAREETESGRGTKNAVLEVRGEGAYDALRWESGVHRVQRVPETERSGRVHTSTAAVTVLPLSHETPGSAPQQQQQLFDLKDVKIEVMRARGAGGQHVNKTESAVRLTHLPTGITVSMQDERSQHRNRDKAFQVLSARLLDRKLQQEVTERRSVRRALVRGADRSEKVRTYNWAQGRVTDHRINFTINNLDAVLEGDALGMIIDALKKNHDAALMEDLLESQSRISM